MEIKNQYNKNNQSSSNKLNIKINTNFVLNSNQASQLPSTTSSNFL